MIAFILAGGFATRLWPLTERRAKPLLPLAGKPILDHILEKIPTDMPVIVSTNDAFAQDFEEWKKTTKRSNIEIRIERTKSDDEKLGALGAVAQWITEEAIEDDVLLLTGDNYIGFDLNKFIDQYKDGTPLLAAFDVQEIEEAKKFGTVITDQTHTNVTAFEEKPLEPKSTLVSTGCSIIPRRQLPTLINFAAKHPDNVGGIFEEFLRNGTPVHCFTFSEPWFDIGSFETYVQATQKLVGENVLQAEGVHTINATLEGSVVLGKNSTITDSTLRNTVLFEGSVIENCVLEECILDNNCILKGVDLRGKMLRAGTKLVRE